MDRKNKYINEYTLIPARIVEAEFKKYQKLIEQAKTKYMEENYSEAIKYYEEAFKIKMLLKDYLMYGYLLVDLEEYNKEYLNPYYKNRESKHKIKVAKQVKKKEFINIFMKVFDK